MKRIFTLLILSASMALSAQNLLTNGSFESWTDGKPDGWVGSKNQVPVSGINESSDAQDGAKSVAVKNIENGHKRFTSQPINLNVEKNYTLTYYIKGVGEVRNSFFNGNPDSSGSGFASYSPYTAATDTWQQVTYNFTTTEDVTGVEIVFSIRNTSEEGVLIDNAVLTEIGEVSAIEVDNIGELRNGATTGNVTYKLTGEALLTYKISNRNQKYIQDATGGILIDDAAGKLADLGEVGDHLTGITGTLNLFNGLMQFVPTDSDATVASSGNAVNYEVVEVSDYLANPTTYESKLIAFNAVNIADAEEGDGTFQNGKNYPITKGDSEVQGRVQVFNTPIVGKAVPTTPSLIIGFGGRFNATLQLFLVDVDAALGVNDLNVSNVSMTTVWTNQAVVATKGNASVEIYNMNGQLVQTAKGSNQFNVNVSSLSKGTYVVKVVVDGKVSTFKAIKK